MRESCSQFDSLPLLPPYVAHTFLLAAPFTFSAPFRPRDPRRAAVLPTCDPRIHFALNCGAKSCPPIKTFTASAVQEELRVVALAFCEQEDNVLVDVAKRTVALSQIFNW